MIYDDGFSEKELDRISKVNTGGDWIEIKLKGSFRATGHVRHGTDVIHSITN